MNTLFDVLDERPLTPVEVAVLSQLIVQCDQPFSRDPSSFLAAIEAEMQSTCQVWDSFRDRLRPSLDIRQLRRFAHSRHGVRAQIVPMVMCMFAFVILVMAIALGYPTRGVGPTDITSDITESAPLYAIMSLVARKAKSGE